MLGFQWDTFWELANLHSPSTNGHFWNLGHESVPTNPTSPNWPGTQHGAGSYWGPLWNNWDLNSVLLPNHRDNLGQNVPAPAPSIKLRCLCSQCSAGWLLWISWGVQIIPHRARNFCTFSLCLATYTAPDGMPNFENVLKWPALTKIPPLHLQWISESDVGLVCE